LWTIIGPILWNFTEFLVSEARSLPFIGNPASGSPHFLQSSALQFNAKLHAQDLFSKTRAPDPSAFRKLAAYTALGYAENVRFVTDVIPWAVAEGGARLGAKLFGTQRSQHDKDVLASYFNTAGQVMQWGWGKLTKGLPYSEYTNPTMPQNRKLWWMGMGACIALPVLGTIAVMNAGRIGNAGRIVGRGIKTTLEENAAFVRRGAQRAEQEIAGLLENTKLPGLSPALASENDFRLLAAERNMPDNFFAMARTKKITLRSKIAKTATESGSGREVGEVVKDLNAAEVKLNAPPVPAPPADIEQELSSIAGMLSTNHRIRTADSTAENLSVTAAGASVPTAATLPAKASASAEVKAIMRIETRTLVPTKASVPVDAIKIDPGFLTPPMNSDEKSKLVLGVKELAEKLISHPQPSAGLTLETIDHIKTMFALSETAQQINYLPAKAVIGKIEAALKRQKYETVDLESVDKSLRVLGKVILRKRERVRKNLLEKMARGPLETEAAPLQIIVTAPVREVGSAGNLSARFAKLLKRADKNTSLWNPIEIYRRSKLPEFRNTLTSGWPSIKLNAQTIGNIDRVTLGKLNGLYMRMKAGFPGNGFTSNLHITFDQELRAIRAGRKTDLITGKLSVDDIIRLEHFRKDLPPTVEYIPGSSHPAPRARRAIQGNDVTSFPATDLLLYEDLDYLYHFDGLIKEGRIHPEEISLDAFNKLTRRLVELRMAGNTKTFDYKYYSELVKACATRMGRIVG
jgi:hypothetical protein